MIPVETLFLGVPNLQMDVTVKLMTFAQVQIGLEGGGFSKFCKIVNKQLNNKTLLVLAPNLLDWILNINSLLYFLVCLDLVLL